MEVLTRLTLATLSVLPPLVFIWALPFLSNAGFASCDHDWCAISQYIDNTQTTGAFWASVTPLVLLTFYVVQRVAWTPLTFSAALSLLLWGLFTSCPASRTMGLHNASLAGWTVMSIITTVLLNAWSRKKTGKWSVVSLIFTIAFTLTSAPFLISHWFPQAVSASLYILIIPTWFVENEPNI